MEDIISYEQLLSSYGTYESIPYEKLLRTLEWQAKRKTIINRDEHKCQSCNMNETIYLVNKPPYHFDLDGEGEYDTIEDEHGSIIGVEHNLRLVPAPRAVIFHVHHTYYAFNKEPWDYPDESLLTLCGQCHFELHKTTKIPWIDANNISRNLTPCPRCNGAGRLPEYSHVQNGTCFYCNGSMYIELMK